MVVVNMPVDEKYLDRVSKLDEEFQELKTKLSILRKEGKDTFTPELLCLDFPPKLKLARSTYDDKDWEMLRKLLDDITAELETSQQGSLFSQTLEIVQQAFEDARQGRITEAKDKYNSIISMYKNIPQEHKRIIYMACLELRRRLEHDGSG
jgi:5'-deoxynucleotidase YfbR-like HD superfamily hydrolase